ncbi:MAG: hypothetical protein HY892_02135 [Deltaproteobacteria bacterium]|nr:hypothetical protein [Deltaproteobacteria bacterium]
MDFAGALDLAEALGVFFLALERFFFLAAAADGDLVAFFWTRLAFFGADDGCSWLQAAKEKNNRTANVIDQKRRKAEQRILL